MVLDLSGSNCETIFRGDSTDINDYEISFTAFYIGGLLGTGPVDNLDRQT